MHPNDQPSCTVAKIMPSVFTPFRWISSAVKFPRDVVHRIIRRKQHGLVDSMRTVGALSLSKKHAAKSDNDDADPRTEVHTTLGRLTKLQRLRLIRMELTYAGLESLKTIDPVNLFQVARDQVAPATLRQLKGLIETGSHELQRIRTRFTEIGVRHLRELTTLKRLWLSGSEVEDAATRTSEMALELESLRLGGVAVRDEELQHLGELDQLEVLILNDLAISDSGLSHLSQLTSIRTLDLSGNPSITDKGIAPLVYQQSPLVFLSLDNTGIGDGALELLSRLTELQCLYLSETNVTDGGLRHLSGLTKLEALNLSGTRISDAGLDALQHLKQLRRLDLSGSDITDSGIRLLSSLTTLKSLCLDNTRLTDAAAESLASLPNLEMLSVIGTHITSEAVDRQRELHPLLEILR